MSAVATKLKTLWHRVSGKKTTSPSQKADSAFRDSVNFLLEQPLWTFGAFRHHQERMLELTGANSLQARLGGETELVRKIRKNIKMLECMNVFELASNHKDVFTPLSKQLIAEKANVDVDTVENLIREHDMLRADRRWYKIRTQFGRPLPRTAEEREVLAARDRPLSQTEKEILKGEHTKQVNKFMNMKKMTQPPPVSGLYFRHPSKGYDRWRSAPPRREPRFEPPRVHKSNRL